ncbi:hypothetical protein OYE22_16850 [Streptomyces sp. 71268]|uniref:hypothetical protein n=1 Tax=Streptomyces sp. 71268 TaxID=3002640 RepID=UPI0023F7E4C2|nr:hypothetical protein [Streptomyces sp. 71268]WEV26681.1 hypothetical protein OYE22_16850 [Streptomyces sp. 71268]
MARKSENAADDKKRTNKLIHAAMAAPYQSGYQSTDDGEFISLVANGCAASLDGGEYPPRGHGYPSKEG